MKSRKGAVIIRPKKIDNPEDILTPEEQELVLKGETQIKRGEYVTWGDLKKKLDL